MTTKTLSGIYSSAYVLTTPVTTLSITAAGYLGAGLTTAASGVYTVVNAGGVYAAAYGVDLTGAGTLTNTGTVRSGAAGIATFLQYGGVVSNGVSAPGALISGDYGVVITGKAGVVTNSATILANAMGVMFEGVGGVATNLGLIRAISTTGMGIYLQAGGAVTNGAVANTGAVIDAEDGIKAIGAPASVSNFGTIHGRSATLSAGYGVGLLAGGAVVNGSALDTVALIDGPTGVMTAAAAARVTNFGTILGHATTLEVTYGTITIAPTYGVELSAGGSVVNGATQAATARIEGPIGVDIGGAAGTVTNFGTIVGDLSLWAIQLTDTGTVINGAEADKAALIQGGVLIDFGGATTNFGTITGGVVFEGAGALINGSDTDTTALIEGRAGVIGEKVATTVHNFGTISGGINPQLLNEGVILVFGGTVANGDAGDTTALIQGLNGVLIDNASGTVTNFGTITDSGPGAGRGVYLADFGGFIINGSAADATALIRGHVAGAEVTGGVGTIFNFATISGGVTSGVGATLAAGGRIVNGSNTGRTALIAGFHGVAVAGASAVFNNGTIAGSAAVGSYGLILGAGGASAVNGSATNAAALITGNDGAVLYAAAALTNFGTVQAGAGHYAVFFNDPTSRVNAEAGSVFLGTVSGAGVLDVVSGTATMTALQSGGFVEGAGTLALTGGVSVLGAGTQLLVAQITEAGAATVVKVAAVLTDGKVFNQAAGTLTANAADKLTFAGVGSSFAGTLTGAGAVFFVGGSDTLAGATLSAASMVISAATVTLSGAITLTKSLIAASPHLIVAAGGATLTGGATLALTNSATNQITGATAGATLTNGDKITGAGLLGAGSMTLVNQASGVIDGNLSVALVIDTGAATVTNAGVIESAGTGGVTIVSAEANSGSLIVTQGVLTLAGAVTGAGVVWIGGGVADIATTSFGERVAFFGTTGVLELANSQAYAGQVSGFSKSGTTSLDLVDINFVSGVTTAAYSGTAASGVLTVTDGAHTARIHFTGDYTASVWTLSSDGHGGATVVDPTAPRAPSPPHQLLAALAGFGSAAGSAGVMSFTEPRRTPPLAHAP